MSKTIEIKLSDLLKNNETENNTETDYIGKIAKQKAVQDHNQTQGLSFHLYTGARILIWILIVLTAVFILVLAWHMIATEDWQWMSKEQIDRVRDIMMAALASGFVTAYSKKILK